MILSWHEQKAVAMRLALLYLEINDIRSGSSLARLKLLHRPLCLRCKGRRVEKYIFCVLCDSAVR